MGFATNILLGISDGFATTTLLGICYN